jgi:hypothetical protein
VTTTRIARALAATAAAVALACSGLAAADASNHSPTSPAKGFPTYAKGMVVNSNTGNPVQGVLVTLRDPSGDTVIASDTTNARGVFRMDGLDSDEYSLKFRGVPVGYENGWLGCGHGVVPTWGEGCTFAPGPLGKARLDKL